MKIKQDRLFRGIAHTILAVASFLCLIPFILLFNSSFTDENILIKSGYTFFPKKLSFAAYSYLFEKAEIIGRAYGITILVTIIGTTACLVITSMIAYPLSRTDLKGRKVLTFLVVFTMLFNGGLVPTYLLYTKYLDIKNTIWALIIPRLLLNGFNILLMKSYFTNNIPSALIESAKIDGAGEYSIFFKIILPLSLPIMATVGLMSGLTYWNDWNNGLIYITDAKLNSIQLVLNQMITNIQALAATDLGSTSASNTPLPSTSVRMAIAVIAVVPVLIAYPFFQKFFVKGITVGAVKG
ncbi:carbohydrate ABC transporter permease [Clostridium sp. SYSU_GA19001]|uniref:carbohydrate ABC transporter permease n=1 Tax=Clostridium caldaquaticum TaxID=2940653 RepID=UPI002076F1E7|nr:carbohydrate ABC transporter permease [Clostridium caldaquaticum]MCM8710340.1 carbohydrate ABC transporter permease [Clostridium caldaquaticum]